MDSHFSATREDLYHVQMDIKHVQSVQNHHSERLSRLEQRQRDDAALKSVWGTGSPFPGVLSGTPQQGPLQTPSNDVFDDFDDEQGQNLLGALQLDTDEEPVRRGASRANSVRFADPALQGENWGHASRNSGEFGPIRPGSGFGSHPMTERSLSHKSDGRHSSAGHSVHSMQSGRNSSLGLDTNFDIDNLDEDSPIDMPAPPPGFFVLGSVPSIIRCWLTTNFSHNALLYATVCTGAQRSMLDYSLVKELGLADQVQKHPTGRSSIKLPVYLPEAIVTQPCSRASSPAPRLPTLTADFELVGINQRSSIDRKNTMRVFLASDVLRAHSADVLLSRNLLVLYGDDRSKLSIPFVRPEDDAVFKNLGTTNMPPERVELKATAPAFTPIDSKPKIEPAAAVQASSSSAAAVDDFHRQPFESFPVQPLSDVIVGQPNQVASSDPLKNATVSSAPEKQPHDLSIPAINDNQSDIEKHQDNAAGSVETLETSVSESSRRESSVGIWGSWRQGTNPAGVETVESTSGYQKATRGGRNMKVLKSSKATAAATGPSRSSTTVRTGSTYEPVSVRPSLDGRRKSTVTGPENSASIPLPQRWDSKKEVPKLIATIPRSSNPVGGASAFSWMSAGNSKASATVE